MIASSCSFSSLFRRIPSLILLTTVRWRCHKTMSHLQALPLLAAGCRYLVTHCKEAHYQPGTAAVLWQRSSSVAAGCVDRQHHSVQQRRTGYLLNQDSVLSNHKPTVGFCCFPWHMFIKDITLLKMYCSSGETKKSRDEGASRNSLFSRKQKKKQWNLH